MVLRLFDSLICGRATSTKYTIDKFFFAIFVAGLGQPNIILEAINKNLDKKFLYIEKRRRIPEC